ELDGEAVLPPAHVGLLEPSVVQRGHLLEVVRLADAGQVNPACRVDGDTPARVQGLAPEVRHERVRGGRGLSRIEDGEEGVPVPSVVRPQGRLDWEVVDCYPSL